MNTIPDDTISSTTGKTKHDQDYNSDSALKGRPVYMILFQTLMDRKDNLDAVSNTPYHHRPKRSQQNRMLQRKIRKNKAAREEQQRSNSVPPQHHEGAFFKETPRGKAVRPAGIKNQHRFPDNLFTLLRAIDLTSNPGKADIELMKRWSVPLNIIANNTNIWRNEAIADIERLQQLFLKTEINEGEINMVYARLINNMNAHYDCLHQRDSLLFQSNLLSEKISLIRKSRQEKYDKRSNAHTGAGNFSSSDSTKPQSAYNESRGHTGNDATVFTDVTSAKKLKTM